MDVKPITPSFVDIYADDRACILRVARPLYDLVAQELAPRTGVFPLYFWTCLALMVKELGPINAQLLEERDLLQQRIDRWFTENVDESRPERFNQDDYVAFLREIGYIEAPATTTTNAATISHNDDSNSTRHDDDDSFSIRTNHVDHEIARIAAPQLVVPLDNPRFVVNAANARWYSLYDALYASNLVSGTAQGGPSGGYDMVRGLQVIEWTDRFLDAHVPLLDSTSFTQAVRFQLVQQPARLQLVIHTADGKQVQLADPHQWIGYTVFDDDDSNSTPIQVTATTELKSVVFRHHDLHIELQFYRASEIAAGSNAAPNGSKARVRDVVLESAVSTIADMEDSVSAVDAFDKARIYRNWLGLMTGSLSATFASASGGSITRTMAPDRVYRSPDAAANEERVRLHGRSLLLVRNVGLHMYTDAVQILRLSSSSGASTGIWDPVPEGFVDAMFSAFAALHDIRVAQGSRAIRNSRTGSVYIVKPKMHGPKEVAFVCKVFSRVENALELERNTLKIGIMDEERRTTVNLPQCIREAADRVVFINTGFLDRTGDEIRTHLYAGPVVPKNDIKATTWIKAYEEWNVDVGLALGLSGRAQIGKGMWAMPDEMRAMYDTKAAHPRSGANCAWVPSPMAAAIHAAHYHQVDVWAVQRSLPPRRALLADVLVPPVMSASQLAALTPQQRQYEVENNAQGILGYVVRWVGQGIGCSKVPNIDNVNLMEDRATLRISSQHLANWLHHKVVSREQVIQALHKMARIVDSQNARDTHYRPMAEDFDRSLEFQAACRLIFDAETQPNGYTEWILHEARRQCKAAEQAHSRL